MIDDDVQRWRSDTPGCANVIHLNNAAAALIPKPVVDAIVDHVHREASFGGYESADDASDAVDAAYDAVAQLVGGKARNIAVVENATVAFSLALSAFDFKPGDV